jgi:SAM-dependent methyltransferase
MEHNDPKWNYIRHYDRSRVESDEGLPSCYSNPNSVDAWRHDRMLKSLMPLIKAYPKAKWMTIGDGEYGSDANFLIKNGIDALSTSINDDRLRITSERGFISNYQIENAEKISFSDNSFDIVLCKESYHHFPRPPIAFYEMLRVAKLAVVLIEPQESGNKKIFNYIKNFIKIVLRNDKSTLFEPSGNYIYRVNIREIEKMMTSLNYEVIAIKRINDFYHPKLSHGEAIKLSFSFFITQLGIYLQNIFSFLKFCDYGLAIIIGFKQVPPEKLRINFRRKGFQIIYLFKNPYLKS